MVSVSSFNRDSDGWGPLLGVTWQFLTDHGNGRHQAREQTSSSRLCRRSVEVGSAPCPLGAARPHSVVAAPSRPRARCAGGQYACSIRSPAMDSGESMGRRNNTRCCGGLDAPRYPPLPPRRVSLANVPCTLRTWSASQSAPPSASMSCRRRGPRLSPYPCL